MYEVNPHLRVVHAIDVSLGRRCEQDILDVNVGRGVDDEEDGLGHILGAQGCKALIKLIGSFPIAMEADL